MSSTFDDAVVGAGILGLAHAYHLAKQGRRVIVFERSERACGASIRNFGMLWPVGQPAGKMRDMALRSREHWLKVLAASGLWHDQTGSLHLAYHDDEAQVLSEFVAKADGEDFRLLTPQEVVTGSPLINPEGLKTGMWSPTEVCVDPRQIIAELPGWLAREFGVRFEFGCAVSSYERPQIVAGGKRWIAARLIVCGGDDFRTLYPETFEQVGFVRCKLQMLRSQAFGSRLRLGPMLAAGLTLRHYKNFQDCPTLPELKSRVARENPLYDKFGIHVLASQNGAGELILGDSHEYDAEIDPFDKPEIDRLILDYLGSFLTVPDLQITARWHGMYAKHPRDSYFIAQPAEGATVVTGVGGNGMTLSFGLADEVVRKLER